MPIGHSKGPVEPEAAVARQEPSTHFVFMSPMILMVFIITSSLVVGEGENIVSKPVASVPGGAFSHSVSILLSTPTPDAFITYTTNGDQPTQASTRYDGHAIMAFKQVSAGHDPNPADAYNPVTQSSLVLKARAFHAGMVDSEVLEEKFVIDRIESVFNIAYDSPPQTGGSKHTLDLYRPRSLTGRPVLVFVHGGAWESGDKDMYFELGCTFAGDYDITTVVINYELSTSPWLAVHPDHIRDVARAFAWVEEHISQYGGDPGKIVIVGHSAGAHLAALLATDKNWLAEHGLTLDAIDGVLVMSGLYDLPGFVTYPNNPLGLSFFTVATYQVLFRQVFGTANPDALVDPSPARHVAGPQRPFRVVHIVGDLPGLNADALGFFARLQGSGGAMTDIVLLQSADIPVGVRSSLGGHGDEIMAVNTRDFDSVPTRTVADFVKQVTTQLSVRRHFGRK